MAPASGFLKWTDKQFEEFFEKNPAGPWEQLGKSRYVGFVLFTIAHHLEAGQGGSKFALVMRLEGEDRVGWYHEELDALLQELDMITPGLAAIPVNHQTVQYDIPDWAEKFVAEFKRRNPGRPLSNLADLTFYFFETLRGFASKARAEGKGVFVSY